MLEGKDPCSLSRHSALFRTSSRHHRAAAADVYVSSLDIAIIYTELGETELALQRLEQAYGEHADHLPYLKVSPRVHALRSDPRFQQLLHRRGLA